MTRRAVIAEQCAAGLADDCHQFWIALNGLIALRFDPSCPGLSFQCGLFERFRDGDALVDAQQSLRIGQTERPRWHEHPINDGKECRYDQEEIDHPGHRRVELLDAVPFMTGGRVACMGVALFYRHGTSSSRRMDSAASSNCFLFDGQKA